MRFRFSQRRSLEPFLFLGARRLSCAVRIHLTRSDRNAGISFLEQCASGNLQSNGRGQRMRSLLRVVKVEIFNEDWTIVRVVYEKTPKSVGAMAAAPPPRVPGDSLQHNTSVSSRFSLIHVF